MEKKITVVAGPNGSGKTTKDRIAEGESLSFESTLSGRTWYPILKNAKSHGYQIEFYFVMVKKNEP
jgi:predicted ABC-type ATPase